MGTSDPFQSLIPLIPLLQVPYARSEAHLTELLERVCEKMKEYGEQLDPGTQRKSYVRVLSRDGTKLDLSGVSIDGDVASSLKFAVGLGLSLPPRQLRGAGWRLRQDPALTHSGSHCSVRASRRSTRMNSSSSSPTRPTTSRTGSAASARVSPGSPPPRGWFWLQGPPKPPHPNGAAPLWPPEPLWPGLAAAPMAGCPPAAPPFPQGYFQLTNTGVRPCRNLGASPVLSMGHAPCLQRGAEPVLPVPWCCPLAPQTCVTTRCTSRTMNSDRARAPRARDGPYLSLHLVPTGMHRGTRRHRSRHRSLTPAGALGLFIVPVWSRGHRDIPVGQLPGTDLLLPGRGPWALGLPLCAAGNKGAARCPCRGPK